MWHRTQFEGSSLVHAISFDTEKGLLEVEFHGKKEGTPGAKYQYLEVPAETYLEFLDAESKGKYFGAKIRGRFKTVKLEPEVEEELDASKQQAQPSPEA
jgi:KTSC domain